MANEPIRVFLIEDEPTSVRMIERQLHYLAPGEFSTAHAGSLTLGLQRLAETDYDVVLLDLVLPDSHGLQTFERLHAHAPHLPVVIVSGLDAREVAIAALRAGAQDHLVKGQYTGELLVRAIRYALERKQVSNALVASEAKLRELFDEAPIGYHELDLEGRIVRVNRTELTLLGYTEEEMLGHYDWEFSDNPELTRQAFAEQRPAYVPERWYRRRDGSLVPVVLAGRLLHDDQGNVIGWRSTMQDVSELVEHRRRREALLRIARQLAAESRPQRVMRTLLDEAVTLIGGDSGAFNRWDERQRVLLPLYTTLPSVEVPAVVPLGVGAAGQAVQRRKTIIINDYPHHPGVVPESRRGGVHAALAAPLLHEGRLLGALAIFSHDPRWRFTRPDAEVVELLAGLAAAVLVTLEAARLEGALLAARTAVHEINNRLAVTVGYTELLAHNPDLPPQLMELASEAHLGATDAAQILQRLQRITRLEEKTWGEHAQPTIDLTQSGE